MSNKTFRFRSIESRKSEQFNYAQDYGVFVDINFLVQCENEPSLEFYREICREWEAYAAEEAY